MHNTEARQGTKGDEEDLFGKNGFYIEDEDDVGDGDVDDDDHNHTHPHHHDYIDNDESDKPAAIVATKPMPHCPHE